MKMVVRSLLAIAVLLTASPAVAQNDDRARALEYFRLSSAEYDAGRFEQAATLLRQALELHDDEPMLHYNLARALGEMGDAAGAIASYETFLEMSPEAANRSSVESRLRVLREQIADRAQLEGERDEARAQQQRIAAEAEQERRAADDEPVQTEPTAAEEDGGGGGSGPAPWLLAGGGVAIVGAGVVFGLVGQAKHDDAVVHESQVGAADLADQANTFALLANIFFIAGGVIAAGGVVWGLLTLGGGDDEQDTTLLILPGSIAVRGTFR